MAAMMMNSVATSFAQMLPASPNEGFAPTVTSLEASEGIQLLSISVLLLVFALAVTSADANPQENQTETEEKLQNSQVQLVRPDAIAFRAGVVTGFIGLLMQFPSSPRGGFVPSVTSMESLEGVQLLSVSMLLLVFAMAVKSELQEVAETIEKSKVELVRVDAIAFRFAFVAALVGVIMTFGSTVAIAELASMCRQDFAASVSVLEAPEGIQLMSVSVLLLVFALAISEDATQQEEEETQTRVELVRPEAIAFRFSVMAAFVGALKTFGEVAVAVWLGVAHMLPAGPREGFAPTEVSLEAPEGIQLLCVSVLLLVFALAITCEDASEQEDQAETKKKTQVELVRADAIAFRSAMAAGLVGLSKILPASPDFGSTIVSLEASEGIQLLCISVLLLVFAVAVNSDDVSSEAEENETTEKEQVRLVRADAIAFRSAVLAALVGVLMVFGNTHARAAFSSMNETEFAPNVAMDEPHQGIQLLIVSVLLFVFTAAVNSENGEQQKSTSESKKVSQDVVELVRPETIAFRLAVLAGLIGSFMTIDNGIITLPRIAVTGEVVLVLGTGMAVMLSDIPRQLVTA